MVYVDSLISIVIITCNREQELKRAIDSCIKFADMNCEIIVVDNHSTDQTKEMIGNIITPAHISLRPYFMSHNLGVAGARNYGFKMANSRVVFFIDDDAYFAEGSLSIANAYAKMLENSNVFAIATEIYDLKKKSLLKDISDKRDPGKVFSYIGASHFIRKDYVLVKDLYPETLIYGAEEIYACLGAYKQGYNIEYNAQIRVIHNPSGLTRLSDFENSRNIHINKFIIKKLTLPKILLSISTIMFYLRLIKFCKLSLKKYYECYELYNIRYMENRYATNKLTYKSIIELMRRFGINRVL